MIKDNQVWENKTKIVKLEKANGKMHGIIFKIRTSGLRFENILSFTSFSTIEKFLKKSRMRLTDKVLTIE